MSLRMALVLAFLVVTTGVSAGLGVLGYLDQRDRLRTKVEEDARRAADRLAESLRSPAWNFDRNQVHQLVASELSASEHLAWIAYDLGPRLREVCLRGEDGAVRWLPDAGGGGPVDQTRTICAPHQRQENLGSLRLAVTWEPMRSELARRRDESLMQVGVLAVVMVVLAGVVVHRVLVRRLGSLAGLLAHAPEAHEDIAAGHDEFTRLVNGSQALLGRLVAVLDAIGDGVATVDRQGRVQRLNPSAIRLLGGAGATGSLGIHDLLRGLPGGRALADQVLAQVVARGEALAPEDPLAVADTGDRERCLLFSAHPVRQGERVMGAVLVLRDVTLEAKARNRLLQAEKLESIGRMAGGIAHDFNNLLTVIVSSAELSIDCDDRARRHALVRNILNAAAQAADFNRKLLAFARKDAIHRATVDLRQVVEQAASLLTHASNGRMALATQVPSAPIVADVDRSALVNCLINLGVNARDAMPEGGRFLISLTTAALDPGQSIPGLVHGQVPQGPCAVIAAIDQGSGIPTALLPRIFEPFFTTKPLGEGTGLGLAAVYGTVRAHHGAIAVESQPGHSEFRLYLPLSCGRPLETGAEADDRSWHGAGTVLLVDDDSTVRTLGKALLETLGFTVIAVDDGAQGVAAFRLHRERIRLVLLDVLMPVMTGEAAAAQIRAIDPAARIVFVTGYSGEAGADTLARNASAVVSKPYRMEELRRVIRHCLGE